MMSKILFRQCKGILLEVVWDRKVMAGIQHTLRIDHLWCAYCFYGKHMARLSGRLQMLFHALEIQRCSKSNFAAQLNKVYNGFVSLEWSKPTRP